MKDENKINLVAVDYNGGTPKCWSCFFYELGECRGRQCYPSQREDGRNIFWTEEETE